MGKKGTVQGVEMFQYIHSRATSLIQNVCNVQKYTENIQVRIVQYGGKIT
jgi:hypothetical protein